jgi:hypothetical protein
MNTGTIRQTRLVCFCCVLLGLVSGCTDAGPEGNAGEGRQRTIPVTVAESRRK